MTTYRTRDQRVADDAMAGVVGYTADLMCQAKPCPNRWSVDSTKLCSWHNSAPYHLWPQITQEQQWHETERARRVPDPVVKLTAAEKAAIVRKMRGIAANMGRQPTRQWAYDLQSREQSGERLTQAQRAAWRDALGVRT